MSNTYRTVQGDKWDSIAFSQMGSCSYTDKLMKLNTQYLGYFIFPAGIILTLPEKEDTVNQKLPPWKKVQK